MYATIKSLMLQHLLFCFLESCYYSRLLLQVTNYTQPIYFPHITPIPIAKATLLLDSCALASIWMSPGGNARTARSQIQEVNLLSRTGLGRD